jgi:hypothetical protein
MEHPKRGALATRPACAGARSVPFVISALRIIQKFIKIYGKVLACYKKLEEFVYENRSVAIIASHGNKQFIRERKLNKRAAALVGVHTNISINRQLEINTTNCPNCQTSGDKNNSKCRSGCVFISSLASTAN